MKTESKFKIASRYAEALYKGAEQDGDVRHVMDDMEALRINLAGDAQTVKYLANPLWSVEDKKDALNQVAKKLKLSQETLRCLYLIAERNRFAELGLILDDFCHTYYEKHDIVEVKVETVKPLTKTQDEKLKANLEKMLAKKVLIEYRVNPEILGGLVVSYGSDMIDDSICGKLNRLENLMKGGQ